MPSAPPTIKVMNISRGARIGADGQSIRFFNITFRVNDQVTDGIEVPGDQLDPAAVEAALRDRAQKIADILAIE